MSSIKNPFKKKFEKDSAKIKNRKKKRFSIPPKKREDIIISEFKEIPLNFMMDEDQIKNKKLGRKISQSETNLREIASLAMTASQKETKNSPYQKNNNFVTDTDNCKESGLKIESQIAENDEFKKSLVARFSKKIVSYPSLFEGFEKFVKNQKQNKILKTSAAKNSGFKNSFI